MKKVLVIAFYFPPLGGGGVQRPLKFVKYLREFGWEPIVLTIKPFAFKYARDFSLMNEIPAGIKIYRAPYFHISGFPLMGGTTGKYLYKPFERKYLIPNKEVAWNRFAVKKAAKVIADENIDLIYTTIPPNSVNLIGEKVKQITGIPWVCDIRDEWTTDQKMQRFFKSLEPGRVLQEKKLEKRTLSFADRITIISELAKNRIVEFNNLNKSKIDVIPNGYDAEDFENYSPEYPPRGTKLKIAHPGNLSTRSFASFLQALQNLILSNKIDENKIEVSFISSSRTKKIRKYFDSPAVKFLPYKNHRQLINDLSAYHALLLYIEKNEATIVTGKLFEYLAARRIIFAVIPKDGVAADIIRECRAGIISDSANVSEIETNLLSLYNDWESNSIEYNANEEEIMKYERKRLTGLLSNTFNSTINK